MKDFTKHFSGKTGEIISFSPLTKALLIAVIVHSSLFIAFPAYHHPTASFTPEKMYKLSISLSSRLQEEVTDHLSPSQQASQPPPSLSKSSDTASRPSAPLQLKDLIAIIDKTSLEQSREKTKTISSRVYSPEEAHYLRRWEQKIESLGNRYYPKQAKINNIQGHLRLLVAIRKDGRIQRVSIRQSSGYKILDQAALRIVKRAAPFDPLPEAIANETDILEIIRTWDFRGAYLKTTGP